MIQDLNRVKRADNLQTAMRPLSPAHDFVDMPDISDLDLPDFDTPEDLGIPGDYLPADPFPDWHQWLAYSLATS